MPLPLESHLCHQEQNKHLAAESQQPSTVLVQRFGSPLMVLPVFSKYKQLPPKFIGPLELDSMVNHVSAHLK